MSNSSDRAAQLSPVKRALLAVEQMQSKLDAAERARTEPIAVIGMACRFPQADSPAAFWRLLRDGVDAVTEVPADRWDVEDHFDPDPAAPGKMYTRWGAFLDRVDAFDPAFFGISPREATSLDPQQRLLLEVAWEGLEHAGQSLDDLAGSKTGVFVGMMNNEYFQHLKLQGLDAIDAYYGTGNVMSSGAGRLSYVLGFQGPSMTVDTACSASLVATHLACQSLRGGESDMALAGGVNLILLPDVSVYMSKARTMAADGRCKTFDARADGYVRGEGCGVVVLKRLSDALAAGDPVLAVIRGSAVMHDGRSSGFTVPSGGAQQAVIRAALKQAGVEPAAIGYVEAHGTGTPLGDPVEMRALGAALACERPHELLIGSVKTNIGHLEAAAGVAGLIKTVLALQHGEVPPHLHFRALNPQIPLAEIGARIPTEPLPWPGGARRRFAGLSSFGLTGTIAHVVLEEAPAAAASAPTDSGRGVTADAAAAEVQINDARPQLLTLSARDPEALRDLARRYHEHLSGPGADESAADVCYTAAARRTHHEHRLALTGSTRAELAERLAAFERGETQPSVAAGRRPAGQPPGVVFVFPGQGSQWAGMGRRLLREEPAFRASVEHSDALIGEHLGWSLLEELEADEARSRLAEIDVVQPAIFAVQVALAALWRSWGVEPEAVVGQSMGEVAAAHVAGALSLEDAAKIICRRSRLLRRQSGAGSMAAVELPLAETRAALAGYEGRLSVGVSSSPTATVVSGETEALEDLLATLERRGVYCRRIKVDIASHSPHMEPLRDELLRELAGVEPLAPALPVYSTVIGGRARELRFDAAYWWRNLREPVLFWGAVERLLEDGYQTFLEVSPHPVVLGSIQQGLYALGRTAALLPSLRREEDERAVMLGSLGSLYASGHRVNWPGLFPRGGRCVDLPTYPWRRERFWASPAAGPTVPAAASRAARGGGRHPLLGTHVAPAHESISHLWELRLELRDLPFLEDHRVQGAAVLPATAYAEMASAAAAEVFAGRPFRLAPVELRKALFVPAEGARLVQLSFTDEADGVAFRVDSRPEDAPEADGAWATHATGRIRFTVDATADAPWADGLDAARARCREEASAEEFYTLLEAAGYDYGPSFRSVERVWRRDGEAVARLAVPQQVAADAAAYRLHPAVLDCGLQLLSATLPPGDAAGRPTAFVPTAFEEARLHGARPKCLWARASLRTGDGDAHLLKGDVSLFDEEGRVVAEFVGVELRSLEGGAARLETSSVADWVYEPRWEEQPREAAGVAPREGGGSWLVFADAGGVGGALSALLEERGERAILVKAGAEYGRAGDGGFFARPSQKEDLRRLWQEVKEVAPGGCRGVAYLWGLDGFDPDSCDAESLAGEPLDACLSVVQFLQLVADEDAGARPRLHLVTRGAQAVGGERRIAVTHAPLWGLGRTVAQEVPELFGGLVDLDAEEDAAESARRLHEELAAPGDEPQVAFRRGGRYVCRLRRLPAQGEVRPSAQGEARRAPRFYADASYLITGGLGALGLEVARWMVGRGARRIILLGRAALPPRREWRSVERGTPLARRLEAIQELEALGVAVHLAAVDVADEARLADFLDSYAEEGWPRIRGVVHAAGALRDATLTRLDAAAFTAVWRPKVVGGWLLHRAFAAAELDFMVFFSSAASLLGSPGQANYAAANAFMDALACERRAQGLPALSVNWGAWSEVGLAATEERGGRLARHGFGGIPSRQGMEALELLMAHDAPQAGVIPVDWALVRRSQPAVAALPLFAHVAFASHGAAAAAATAAAPPPGLTRDTLDAAGEGERQSLLEDYFGELVSRILGVRRQALDPLRPLNTLGLDSLMAIEFKNSVERTLRLSLPMVALMQGPSIRELSARMLEQLAGRDAGEPPNGVADEAAAPTQEGGLSHEQAEELLAGIDSLSPERVNSLLASMLD